MQLLRGGGHFGLLPSIAKGTRMSEFRVTKPHMLRESKAYASQTLMGGLSGFESPIGLDRRDRLDALKTGDIGFVHSWDINTSVDGPGTRMTVFMSGCPLRCQYCQNPDGRKAPVKMPYPAGLLLCPLSGHLLFYGSVRVRRQHYA